MTNNLKSTTINNNASASNTSNGPNLNQYKKTSTDFKFERMIGEGSFSTVMKAREVKTDRIFAIKTCEKDRIRQEKMHDAILREKEIMAKLTSHQSPFFVRLYYSFQDEQRLFFVMDYAENGELLKYLNKVGSFDEDCTRFYSAEIVLALEHLHRLNIVHRDLKPENILLNSKMHIQITDFGSACILEPQQQSDQKPSTPNNNQLKPGSDVGRRRKNSFVGTVHYISPEMYGHLSIFGLSNIKKVGRAVDLWALGCIIYQLSSGSLAFKGSSEYLIFQKVLKLDYQFPDGFNAVIRDLIEQFLKIEPDERLGAQDKATNGNLIYKSIRAHPFFKPLENRWENLHKEEAPKISPYLPRSNSEDELRSEFKCSEDIEPGLDDKQMTRLLGLQLYDESSDQSSSHLHRKSIMDFSLEEMKARLEKQKKESKWNRFVDNNLIIKEGFINKRKGFFARKRMFLLTTGPHIYYIDATNERNPVLKGEIPFTIHLSPELKTFKNFFVHTPKRVYYLEDPDGFAKKWVEAINDVKKYYKKELEERDRIEKEREKEINKLV